MRTESLMPVNLQTADAAGFAQCAEQAAVAGFLPLFIGEIGSDVEAPAGPARAAEIDPATETGSSSILACFLMAPAPTPLPEVVAVPEFDGSSGTQQEITGSPKAAEGPAGNRPGAPSLVGAFPEAPEVAQSASATGFDRCLSETVWSGTSHGGAQPEPAKSDSGMPPATIRDNPAGRAVLPEPAEVEPPLILQTKGKGASKAIDVDGRTQPPHPAIAPVPNEVPSGKTPPYVFLTPAGRPVPAGMVAANAGPFAGRDLAAELQVPEAAAGNAQAESAEPQAAVAVPQLEAKQAALDPGTLRAATILEFQAGVAIRKPAAQDAPRSGSPVIQSIAAGRTRSSDPKSATATEKRVTEIPVASAGVDAAVKPVLPASTAARQVEGMPAADDATDVDAGTVDPTATPSAPRPDTRRDLAAGPESASPQTGKSQEPTPKQSAPASTMASGASRPADTPASARGERSVAFSSQLQAAQAHDGGRAAKVAAPAPANAPVPTASPEEFGLNLAEKVRFVAENGSGRIRLQLHPAQLGHLEIRAESGVAGVTARIVAETSAVRDYIETNIHHLERALADQGLKVHEIEVSVQTSTDPQWGQRTFNQDTSDGQPRSTPNSRGRESHGHAGDSRSSETAAARPLGPNSTFHAVA